MKFNSGWSRIWFVLTLMLFGWQLWSSFNDKDIYSAVEGQWRCVPETISSQFEQEIDGFHPIPKEALDEALSNREKITGKKPDDLDLMIVQSRLQRPILKTVEYFNCSSWWSLVAAIMKSLLISGLIAVSYFVCRWIIQGFQRSREDVS